MTPYPKSRLPKAIIDRLLAGLVRRGRLAPLGTGQPLVQYFYGGIGRRNGKMQHQVTILSRVAGGEGEKEEFKTTFYLAEDASEIEMAD